EHIPQSWEPPRTVAAGLKNTGNACYLNATLQCLTHTGPLASHMLALRTSQMACQKTTCMMCVMQAHLERAFQHSGAIIQPCALGAGFHVHKQEDAHEFLMFILESMEKSHQSCGMGLDLAGREPGLIREIFGGSWRSQITCFQCQSTSDTFDPYLDITLDIAGAQSVEQALARLVEPEELAGEDAYHCGVCLHKVSASKTLTLHSASKVLILVLKRFSPLTGDKVDGLVRFPQRPDMQPYMSQPREGPLVYDLYAVLVHAGWSSHSGHYFSYIKAGNGQWYKMDDAKVSTCAVSSVLSQPAYVLFYSQEGSHEKGNALGPREHIPQSWEPPRTVAAGLKNTGNACYLNATLQCLTHTGPLASHMLALRTSQMACQKTTCMMCVMQAHLERAFQHSGAIIQPCALGAGFHVHKQEDAHEFLMFILESMEKSHQSCGMGLDLAGREPGLIREIFGGSWRSQITCFQCQSTSDTFDPYLDITLDIAGAQSVEQALARLVEPEELAGEDAYHCGVCLHKVSASKTLTLHSASKVLILVLKRFSPLTGDKVDGLVRFPQRPDMQPYMSQPREGPLVYDLYAVLVHAGWSSHSGHYFSYIKAGNGQWYKMDDAKVSTCAVSSVLSQPAYVLFYSQEGSHEKGNALGPREHIPQSWEPPRTVAAGLKNTGNACYLNATLQCLTHTGPLASHMLALRTSQMACQKTTCMMCVMQAHLERAFQHSGAIIQPCALGAGFHVHKQEDAHEFLMFILESMEKSHQSCGMGLDLAGREPGLIREIFGGSWRSQITCFQCQSTSDTFDPYLDITLDIAGAQSVEQALARLVEPEELAGEDAYHCGVCLHKVSASKTLTLHSASKVLILVLKRFSPLTGDKVDGLVRFPQRPDMQPYMSQPREGPLVYDLYAVLVHAGWSSHSGHYFSYIKAGNGQWYKMDDAKVSTCAVSSVLSQPAYVLFYSQEGSHEKGNALGPREHIPQSWEPPRTVAAGLKNTGNACYLNATLQCLTHTGPLASHMLALRTSQMACQKTTCMMCVMQAHLERAFQHSGAIIQPCALGAGFHVHKQEDAHEFLMFILESMEKSHQSCGMGLDLAGREPGLIREIFGGSWRSQITCFQCQSTSDTFDPYLDITLDIAGAQSVEQALARLVEPEELAGEDAYHCGVCLHKVSASKTLTLHSASKVLILVLKRFSPLTGDKVDGLVRFPQRPDMQPYMSQPREGPLVYDLYAVLVHAGWSSHSGHYFSYIKAGNGQWYKMDDAKVSTCAVSSVLSQPAYVLFYSQEGSHEKGNALGPREHIPQSWEPPRTVAAGLKNTGNACYLNATLQCLTHTGPLASHMLALRTSQMACQKTTCMMCVMQAHLERAFQHSGAIIQPCALGAGFHVHKQEDAHEFLMFILESMEKSHQSCGMGLDLAGREPGLIREIFGGSWRSQITCFQCQSTSDTFDPYLDITLDIAGAQSVEQALARLVEPEELAREDAYHCGVCLHKVSASKTLTLHSASKVLILVLKRFSPLTGDKVDGLVRFPQRPDMQPYMSQPREGPLVYDLYAVLVHAGWSSHSGHYFSYIKAGNGQWYKMDDAKVSTCAVSSVLSQPAYVLFYSQEGSHEKGNALGPREHIPQSWEPPRTVAAGLKNTGNACYLNATLQCLTHTGPLASHMLALRTSQMACQKTTCMMCVMQAHLERAFQHSGAIIQPCALGAGFHVHKQEDAHEFLMFILESMEKSHQSCGMGLDLAGREPGLIREIFGGSWRSQITCFQCQSTSDTFDPYLDITLDIAGAQSVEQALARLVEPEELAGEDAYHCGVCLHKVSASKTLTLHSASKVLILVLKRFSPLTGDKVDGLVRFPQRPDMQPYMSQPREGPLVYDLYAVLVHAGWSSHSGHYFSYIKAGNGQWYKMDDAKVSTCAVSSVLSQPAYVLFYSQEGSHEKGNALGPREHIPQSWEPPRTVAAGLKNTGNACYLNATLQCLTHTGPLASHMLALRTSQMACQKTTCMMCVMQAHLERAFQHSGAIIQPCALGAGFHVHKQEDAHEFLMFILESMEKSHQSCGMGLDLAGREPGLIREIFGGSWRSQITCFQCQSTSDTFDPYLDITLDIAGAQSVEQALARLVEPEELAGEDAYHCGVCLHKVSASKTLTLHSASKVLILVLKRFSPLTGDKVDGLVRFPQRPDMQPYMSQPREGPLVYDLYAVLVHAGWSSHSGHYFSYIKAGNGQWYKMDDAKVSTCAVSSVLSQPAYVLFYSQEGSHEKGNALGPREHIPQSWEPPRTVAAGLKNTGNACYLNATLQCLTHTGPLASHMLALRTSQMACQKTTCMMCVMQAHLERAFQHSGAIIQPCALGAGFHVHKQEDAHEFLMFILESMEKSHQSCGMGLDLAGREPGLIREIFGGSWRSQITCFQCQSTSDTFDPYLDITLDIAGAQSVEQALARLVEPEELAGEDAYHCGVCLHKVSASKTLTLHSASKVLILVLKRFSPLTGDKVDGLVRFPQRPDMQPYMSQPREGPLVYDLYAVLVHAGWSSHSGHYFSYIKAGNGQWYKMDDAKVSTCAVSSVLSQPAYVLFYSQEGSHEKGNALGPREHIPQSWEPPRTVAAGLKNTGNACYLNATLQCLTHTGPLASHMLALRTSQMACQKTTCMMCVMQAHLERAFQHSGAIIQPCALGAGFHVHKQEDAHEFLMFILESMEKSHQSCGMGLDLAGREPGLIREIFGGSWRSQITCFQCQSTSDTFDPYLDITLDIAGAQSVEQALARLVEPEELAGEDAYHCGVCLHKVSASKTLTLHSASKVLILVLKRFSPLTGDKVDGLVRFPQRPDMQPYMSQPREGPLVYDLYAVLVHAGWSSHSGHYFSYIKAGNGQWYKMDDAKVSTCAVSSVLSQPAYVLFYSQEGSHEKGNALGPREHIPQSWEPPRTVAAGLKNTGNACYLNATLQCLTHTGPLASHMLALRTSQMACQKTTCMMCVMQAHLERAFQHSGAIIQPCALGAGFHVHKQEDAHEFLMFILESMEKSHQSCGMGLDLAGREPGLIREIFGGSWRSQITCFQCQSTSDTFDPYLDITLDIAGAQSVEQALARLVEPEELAGEDAYHCGVCLHKVSASKTLTLHSASKVLILVLKRFSPLTGDKVDGLVRFPQRPDMQPYMSQPREGPLVYDLYAVLVHAGWSSHSGHYFSYIKAGNGQWYKMDDAKVSTCAVSSVLSQPAYVLFYSQEGSHEKGN
ncbi:LOW QUALITY PROTEIN: uncharacterized protein RHO17_005089, partial [Thomomys bottae]